MSNGSQSQGQTQGYYQGSIPLPQKGWRDETNLLQVKEDTKEYTIVGLFEGKNAAHYFDLMSNALTHSTWELIDLDSYQTNINNTIRSMKILKRFRVLQTLMSDLRYTHDEGFLIGDSSFETLDEVEK